MHRPEVQADRRIRDVFWEDQPPLMRDFRDPGGCQIHSKAGQHSMHKSHSPLEQPRLPRDPIDDSRHDKSGRQPPKRRGIAARSDVPVVSQRTESEHREKRQQQLVDRFERLGVRPPQRSLHDISGGKADNHQSVERDDGGSQIKMQERITEATCDQ